MKITKNDRYITDQYDSIYEWSQSNAAYVFVGKLNGRTLAKAIRDLEEAEARIY